MTVLAHISDLHLDGGRERAERARRLVSYLCELPGRVDAVLITGDLAENGSAAEYAQVRDVLMPLRARFPVLACPGNHDVRNGFLLDHASDEPVNTATDVGGVRVLLADSLISGSADGLLTAETLDWLDATLAAERGVPTFVGFHHPPVELGIPYVDAIRLREPARLAAVLARHPQVVAVLCGHAHASVSTTFAGLPLLVAPGVVSTLALPWEQAESWSYQDDCPSLMFHVHAAGILTTHVRMVSAR